MGFEDKQPLNDDFVNNLVRTQLSVTVGLTRLTGDKEFNGIKKGCLTSVVLANQDGETIKPVEHQVLETAEVGDC